MSVRSSGVVDRVGTRTSGQERQVGVEMRRVLLVDDDPTLLHVLATVLDLEDFHVTTAADGHEALARVGQDGADVVVCDVSMPGIDGFEVCRRLKDDPATAGIPVVLLTARGGDGDRATGASVGCDAYLVKPFSPLELIELVRTIDVARSED